MHDSWYEELKEELSQDYMHRLRNFLNSELKRFVIFPKMNDVFNAFLFTPFNQVKVVILGQDPYHNIGQAHGLCFSVLNQQPPPSLQNIFKELESDLGIKINQPSPHPAHESSQKYGLGNLIPWAQQGIFLLNTVLTVRSRQAASHQNQGWEIFTDQIIKILNQKKTHLVFLLWGSFAQKKRSMIDETRHFVLQAPHPSPLSAHRGFFGCKHFSKTNEYLASQGINSIDWSL